jgi:hypothetical protein
MNILFWGLTIGMIGKVMLAIGVLIAHSELAHERRIDSRVLRSFRLEHTLTVTGLVLIVVGYLMEIYFYNFLHMIDCFGPDCAMSAALLLSQ